MEGLRLIMNLSSIITGVPEYIEFGNVVAPTAAAEVIATNTVTTLLINTEVSDSGGLVGSPTSNEFTVPAGTYYYEASTSGDFDNFSAGVFHAILSLQKSDGTYISRANYTISATTRHSAICVLSGQFTIATSTAFRLTMLTNQDFYIGRDAPAFTISTANADQRTTIKLWKLK